ncbi:resolvase [Carnobacterium divergens]|uniref:recombinase family protein n=1 Tax=Carnobacterium divergens TaxID=2748 RepID=UPI0010719220|nr:recombinase family protein [Carnobacterium divergens]TFJ46618.1 resolvase [Carnobacterium divergens]TFJ53581.1 resolvase [Carnobacterium divergens]
MAVIGYMRVSTQHQKFDSQQSALEKYGVDKLFQEYESGRKRERSELNKALKLLKEGDTFVIFKLDRLARGTKQLLTLMEMFEEKKINFVSIENNIDTSTPMGKLMFTIMSAFAEMEVDLIRERILAGLSAAKEKGVTLGRPVQFEKINHALNLYQFTSLSIDEISEECQLSKQTIYTHCKKNSISRKKKKLLTS